MAQRARERALGQYEQTAPFAPEPDGSLRVDENLIRKLAPSEADRRALAEVDVDPSLIADDFFDYSKTVVRKPWGYEYLIFENEFVATWILHIKEGFETSLHCHPGKQTSITVLSGTACCSVLEGRVTRRAGDGMLIGKGVFHRTRSISRGGTFVMEIESPVNKRDLVRLEDQYGREGLGYESADHFSVNLQNYNYFSFIDPTAYYNARKRFGDCSIQLVQCATPADVDRLVRSHQWTAIGLLKGCVSTGGDSPPLRPGDMVSRGELLRAPSFSVDGTIEALVVNRADTLTRLSDYVISSLKDKGLRDMFFVPETTNAHLTDAVGRDTEVRSLALQTEHGATLAAEGFAKLTGRPAVVLLSTGPSATQAIAGVSNAWTDSTPLLVVSGQPRPSDLGVPGEQSLRQLANKELDIVRQVQPVTKRTEVIRDPLSIRVALDDTYRACVSGRAGPAWLDIPIDILGTNIDEAELTSPPPRPAIRIEGRRRWQEQLRETFRWLRQAERPVILVGHGVRASGSEAEFLDLAADLSIPVLTSRRGADLVPHDFPFFFGRPGTYGQRAANFVIQNSDLLISIGCRLSLPLVGRNYSAFAREARKVVVDVDVAELTKATVSVDLGIEADAGEFIREMRRRLPDDIRHGRPEWVARCRRWTHRFPTRGIHDAVTPTGVNPYRFVETLSDALDEHDVVVVDGGATLDYVMQTFRVKNGQRIISSSGLEYRGFALPGAIGAALGGRGQRIVCLCEKKGLQVTIPELQTIVNHALPIKAFIFNSRGDRGVQQVQASYFGGRYVGLDSGGIIGSLDVAKLGEAYQIPTETLSTEDGLRDTVEEMLASAGPALASVDLPEGQEVTPRMTFTVKPDGHWISKPLEDMYPLLERTELRDQMVIDVWDED